MFLKEDLQGNPPLIVFCEKWITAAAAREDLDPGIW